MKKLISIALLIIGFYSGSVFACTGSISEPLLCETPEILFIEDEANILQQKAQELASVVKIYEFLKNEASYAVYHGARSSSLNTFLAMEGNDVDLASTLIALYRSVDIKARYAVGNIRLKREEVANWVGVANAELAVSILQNQGINIVDDTDVNYVVFEHVWVEALVNFSNYRGASANISPCLNEDDQCKWIALDPSFKLKIYQPEYRELLAALEFNYDAYYRAESDQNLRDKSPLEIFEESALVYLRNNHPGITLEDVIDGGEIVEETLGLLPSSLPYEIVGAVKRYDAVAQHDADTTNIHDWNKNIALKIYPIIDGYECQGISMGGTFSAAELSTKRLTVNWGLVNGQTQFSTRLDGVKKGLSIIGNFTINCNGRSELITAASRFNIVLNVDISPFEDPIEVRYNNLMVGGYYLVATGGETSNWSQVRRAYQELLLASEQYPLIDNSQGDVYIDLNNNGIIDLGETPLLDNQEAQDALTGGLLYTAQALYYTRLKEESRRYSRLKNIVSPIAAFAGIVSTTFEVELIDETPFAVLPGGLLIDLKGLRLNGSWVADQPETYSNETFKFLGHMASSLEHEIWQELTGYDAVSTMRGIQFALNADASLMDIHNNNTGDTFEKSLGDMSIGHAPPSGFTQKEYTIFNRRLVGWQYSGNDAANAGFYLFKGDLSSYSASDYQADRYLYNANNGFNNFFAQYDSIENQLNTLIAEENKPDTFLLPVGGATGITITGTPQISGANANLFTFIGHSKPTSDQIQFEIREIGNTPPGTYNIAIDFDFTTGAGSGSHSSTFTLTLRAQLVDISCNNVSYPQITYLQALSQWESCFNTTVNANSNYMNFLDRNVAFNPSTVFYKNKQSALTEYDINFVMDVRNHMYFAPSTAWFNFTAPSALTSGPFYLFEVYIKDTIDASNNNIVSSSYIIKNESMRLFAGGGYVPEGVPIDPATDTEGVIGSGSTIDTSGVTFNNEVFTDQNLVAIANNDVIRTPSTVDPVSTVTGNMYHDETDLVIASKGLPYTFTRTYNSNETTTDGPNSANPNYLPLSQGWTHSYNMKLVSNDYGIYPNYDASLAPENHNNLTSSITYVDERGGESNYLVDDSSASAQPTSPRAGFDNLVFNSPSVGLHTISYNNEVKYIFDSQGANMRTPGTVARLHRIEDAYGNQLNFGYTNNRLTSVTDNLGLSGRSGLTLDYYTSGANNGRLRYLADWTGRQWEYIYADGQLASVKNPLSDAMAYTYIESYVDDGNGARVLKYLLKDIIHPQDRNGKQKTMTFSYYENGQAYDYIDQNGSAESLIYDLFRRRTRVTNPRGLITEHYYDENGALVKFVKPDKGILLFENNEDGLRYIKHNALGQRTRYSYHSSRNLSGAASDTNGQVTREENALGHTTDYNYGIHGQVTTVKDKNGNSFTNEYYSTNNATTGAVVGKLQRKTAASITVNGVVHNNVTLAEYQYNADGTPRKSIAYIDPAQPSRRRISDYNYNYASDGTYSLTTTISGSGTTITTEQHYDSLWRLISTTIYRRTSATDATLIALTTEQTYDEIGRVVSTLDPLGNIAETVFDSNGQVSQTIMRYRLLAANNSPQHSECVIDPAYPEHYSCVMVNNSYDAADRLLRTTNIKGATTQYQYDPMGNVTKVTNDLNNSLRYEYDAAGRRTKVTDEKGYTVKTTYDLAGRVLTITDANKNTITNSYDELGRPITVTSPQGRITRYDQYDANGNVLRLTDANGVSGQQPLNSQNASVANVFDQFNRIVSSLNANNELTQYTYDLQGNRTSVVDANGQSTQFIYDDLGRLITVVDPIIETGSDKVVSITYDEVGNRLSYTDRLGESTQYTYDKLNRLIQENYLADGITADKVYDQYGNMVSTSYAGNNYTYSYDVAHRLLSKTDARKNRSLTWQYDTVGNVIRKTNFEGDLHKYTYDSSNRLVSMAIGDSPLIIHASYHYDPAGRLLSRILSNGAATLYNYTTDGFLTSIKQVGADGYQIDLREYQHDAVGNITKLTVNGTELNGTEVVNYTYDPAYRLLTANSTTNSHDFSYSYDAVGNRTSKTVSGASQHFIYSNGNRLDEVRQTSITGPLIYRLSYDDNGSMTGKFNGTGQTLLNIDYDQRRLARVMAVDNVPNSLAFEYDANAYRIQKKNSIGTKKYYLEAEHLESLYDGNDKLQANYLRGAVVDEIISGFERNASTDLMENRTVHHDQVNSVVALSDHNGQKVQSHSYGPFGEALASIGISQNTMKYTGREQDAESGLYYYRARYYDPELGRFISEDPIGFDGGINFYAYVGNNPLIYNDPSGNIAVTAAVALCAAHPACRGAVGAAVGGVTAVTAQMITNFLMGDNILKGTKSAGIGGLTEGGMLALTGNPLVAAGTGGFTGAISGELIDGDGINFGDVGVKTVSAMLFHGVGTKITGPSNGVSLDVINMETLSKGVYDVAEHTAEFGIAATTKVINNGGLNLGTDAFGVVVGLGLGTLNNITSDTINTHRPGSSGGFLLYPSKINSNQAVRVYAK